MQKNKILLLNDFYCSMPFSHKSSLLTFETRFIKAYKDKSSNFFANNELFNSRWNERYGNVLATAAATYLNSGNKIVLDGVKYGFLALIHNEDWSINGNYDDEVAICHLITGLIVAYDVIEDFISDEERGSYVRKIEEVLNRSLNNKYSNNYVENILAHNHTFWILLMRYFCCRVILSSEGKIESQAMAGYRNIFLYIQERWNYNFALLEKIEEGELFEGASYTSYSVMAIIHYLQAENLRTGDKRFVYSKWLNNYNNYIRDTYDHINHVAFNIGDGPINWSYGPEQQVAFASAYVGIDSCDILKSIEANRIWYHGDRFFNRNADDFLHVWFFIKSAKPENKGCIPTPYTEIIYHRYDKIGVMTLRDNDKTLCIRYGVYGGIEIYKMNKKNIGHSYPFIGGFYFSTLNGVHVANALYQQPKSSKMHPVITVVSNRIEYEQSGCNNGSVKWLDNRRIDYKYSPLTILLANKSLFVAKVDVKSYDIDINHARYFIYSSIHGLIVIDNVSSLDAEDFINIRLTNPLASFIKDGESHLINNLKLSIIGSNQVQLSSEKLSVYEQTYDHSILCISAMPDSSGHVACGAAISFTNTPLNEHVSFEGDFLKVALNDGLDINLDLRRGVLCS